MQKKIYENKEIIDIIKFAIIILIVIGLGLLVVNQTLQYFYKAQFLKSPCSLCKELNPGIFEQQRTNDDVGIIPGELVINLSSLSFPVDHLP